MQSQAFTRLSQAGAVLVAAGFTISACVGADLRTDKDGDTPTILVQTDDGLETAAGGYQQDVPTEGLSTEELSTEVDEPTRYEPTVPGRFLDYGPEAGSELIVVGVEHDDVLNFRAEPSSSAQIVTTRELLDEASIVAVGRAWEIEGAVWWLVAVDGTEAWANQRYLSMSGMPTAITADVVTELSTLRYDDALAAAMAVAHTQASTDPASAITVVNEPVMSDLGGVVVVDVVGLGDDSVGGVRLWIELFMVFDQSGEEGAQEVLGVSVNSVQAMPLCTRGVSDGLCV